LIPDADQNATLETYFVTIRRVGATVLVGAIGEIENDAVLVLRVGILEIVGDA
jgi:hypothetical protein